MGTINSLESNSTTLAAWREKMDFSQRKAALELGCARSSYAEWESGRVRVPKYITLACAALALNISVGGISADEE